MEKIPNVIHESWHQHLQPLFDDPKMNLIKTKLLPSCKFYPDALHIFRVFEMPLDKIEVVILGQDPYLNGEAIGYAFAVNGNKPIPKSLNIIFKEIIKPETSEDFLKKSSILDRTLSNWREQGVFLLNTALTVEIGNAGSHIGQWQWFTREVIKIISKNNPCIWMLWGAKAQGFKDFIVNRGYRGDVNPEYPMNYILEAPHPAAELYSGGKTTFSGCNHFNICNQILEIKNKNIINW